jgi:hypothetical protein
MTQPVHETCCIVRGLSCRPVVDINVMQDRGTRGLPSKEAVIITTGPSFGTFPSAESSVPIDGRNPATRQMSNISH